MNLRQFIKNESLSRSWINEKYIHIYIRRSKRFINGEFHDCLDLASVTVDENMRGKSIFSKFLFKFEKEAKKMNRVVYLENVLEERLQNYLLNVRNYNSLNSHFGVTSFYKNERP